MTQYRAPALENWPAAQFAHADDAAPPTPVFTVPAAHARQLVDPVLG